MYAATSLRDAYRKFRAKDPSYVYAYGKVSYRLSEKFGEGGTPA